MRANQIYTRQQVSFTLDKINIGIMIPWKGGVLKTKSLNNKRFF
jgi:hypothetical protein